MGAGGGEVLVGAGLEVGLDVGFVVAVGGTGVFVGEGVSVAVAVQTTGVFVGGRGVLVGVGVSVGIGVFVGIGVSVKVGLGVLVGVAVTWPICPFAPQAIAPAIMAMARTSKARRFVIFVILPPR